MFSKQPHFLLLTFSIFWALPAGSGKKACSCYTFHGDLRRWYQSRQHCLDNGGDLVSLETVQEWSQINHEIQHRHTDRFGSNEWHIGLTNLTGVWRWLNNKTLTYDRWQEGEPEYVTNKPFVTMAKEWPIGTQGLFNSLREDIPRARICEYKRDCLSIKERCRKLTARFAVTTPKPLRLSTAVLPLFTTRGTTQHKTNPVFKGNNPTSRHNSKTREETPFYIVIIIIILGALIFGCCCIVVLAFRWKKKRKEEKKKTIKVPHTSNDEPPIKTQDSSESSDSNDRVDSQEDEEHMRDTAIDPQEPNGVNNNTKCPRKYRTSSVKHDYAKIMIINDDGEACDGEGDGGGEGDDDEIEETREHRVRFACDQEEASKNGFMRNGKRTDGIKNYKVNGTDHCWKHRNGIMKNGNLDLDNTNDNPKRETQPIDDNHDMEIVKLDVVMPTKEAQYASIVAIHPHCEHDSILKRNKKPFLKTFAPINRSHQNGRTEFENQEQNEGSFEQNSRNFEHHEKYGRMSVDDDEFMMSHTTTDKSIKNSHSAAHEAIYTAVDKATKINKKTAHPHVRLNYVELAEFDKNAVLYTKMPPRYQPTRYTEVEIPNEWD